MEVAAAATNFSVFVPRNCTGSINNFGVIGDGVEVRASSIPEAGSGLWTTRDYSKSDLLTEYSGTYITHEQALQLRADDLDSHVRVVSSFHLCIDGIKEPQAGLGGASFCNDARNSKINNAVFTTRHDKKLGRDRVFLQAKRDIPAGSEVFVSYGNSYWRMRDMPPTVVLANQPARLQAEAAASDNSTPTQSSNSLDSNASTSSSKDRHPGDVTHTDIQGSDSAPAAAAVNDTATSMDLADACDSDSNSTSEPALSTSTHKISKPSPIQEPQAHSMPAQQEDYPVQQQQSAEHVVPQQWQRTARQHPRKHYRSASAGWEVELLRFGCMSIADVQNDAGFHPSTQDQLASHAASTAAQQSRPGSCCPLGTNQEMHSLKTPPGSPSIQHASTARRALSCRHSAPLRQDTGMHRMQQQLSCKPSTQGSAFKALSTRRMLPGLGAMSLSCPIGASLLAFSASPAAVNDRDDRDPCWSPPSKAKKHMQQQLQDLEQQDRAQNGMQRPQRRRRVPDPTIQYNGTMQAAKPIDHWW